MLTLFIPAVDQEHADYLLSLFLALPVELASVMMLQGMVTFSREAADDFRLSLLENHAPGADDAQVFEYEV